MKHTHTILLLLIVFIISCSSEKEQESEEPTVILPTASFRWTPQEPTVGDILNFENLSSNAENYYWEIGEEFSNEISPSVSVNTKGELKVRLIAENGEGLDTLTQYITVLPTPTSLSFRIQDKSGNAVSGVSTTLYKTEEDWKKEQNPITTTVFSDNQGNVFFNHLPEGGIYYLDAQKEFASNWQHTIRLEVREESQNEHPPVLVYENPSSVLSSAKGRTWQIAKLFLLETGEEIDLTGNSFKCTLDDRLTYFKGSSEGDYGADYGTDFCFSEESGLYKWFLDDNNTLSFDYIPGLSLSNIRLIGNDTLYLESRYYAEYSVIAK